MNPFDLKSNRMISCVNVPEVVAFAEDQISFGEEIGTDFAQSTTATAAFETVFVPIRI